MKVDLFQLCSDEEWPEVRKYLYSDAAEEEKKRNMMCRNDYSTCLHRACYRGAPDDIVKVMLDIGGKELLMRKANYDRTVLHSTCINGASYNILKILILVGGKDLVMAKDKHGDTALHWLCWCIKKHTKVAEKIKLILQVGDVDLLLATHNHAGDTPLEIAADNGTSNLIKKLLAEHEEGEGTVVVQSQTQSSKRRRVGNTRNASSGSLDRNQAGNEDAEFIDMLMTRYLDTRKQLQRANARIAQLEEEHAGT
jgi:hypothetical protein